VEYGDVNQKSLGGPCQLFLAGRRLCGAVRAHNRCSCCCCFEVYEGVVVKLRCCDCQEMVQLCE
jgi:hypothetical protein